MTLLVALLGAAGVVLGVVVGASWLDAMSWRRSLLSYRVRFAADLSSLDVTSWLGVLAAMSHASRMSLLPQPPIMFEVIATAAGIEHRISVPTPLRGGLLTSVRAMLPSARLEELEPGVTTSVPRSRTLIAAQLRLVGRSRQLAVERAEASSRALLAGMHPLYDSESVHWEWILSGAGTPAPLRQPDQRDSERSANPWWLEGDVPSDADELRAARLKQRQPLFNVSGRLVVRASTTRRVRSLFGQAWGGFRLLNVPGGQLVRAPWPTGWVARSADRHALPLLWWPLRMNAAELAGALPLPVGESPLPGVGAAVARQLPPPTEMGLKGTVLADSTYPGVDKPLVIDREGRLRHVALLAPTGAGKSTLMINLIRQDIARGDGVAVVDPKADLAADLLGQIESGRQDDVIVADAADASRPVGFNVLAHDGSEAGRDRAVDHTLHVFKNQWADSWGPRTEAVIRASLLVLTSARAIDGSAFTICELPEFLTNTPFRRWVCSQPSVPAAVADFMKWFELLSEAERIQVISPTLTKLTALTQRTGVRLMLGQSEGIDFSAAMRDRRIVIMPLSRGLIGAETASLLSSLIIASVWQSALGRLRVPQAGRRPYWLHIDEVAAVLRLPIELTDMLDQARGLSVGIVLAAQRTTQMPKDIKDAWVGAVRSQVVWQLEPDDARLMARAFEPSMTEADLRSLGPYEVAMRLSINNQTSRPMTGKTRPLSPPISDADALRARSRERYGKPRGEVEEALRRRLGYPARDQTFGRRPRGGEK